MAVYSSRINYSVRTKITEKGVVDIPGRLLACDLAKRNPARHKKETTERVRMHGYVTGNNNNNRN